MIQYAELREKRVGVFQERIKEAGKKTTTFES